MPEPLKEEVKALIEEIQKRILSIEVEIDKMQSFPLSIIQPELKEEHRKKLFAELNFYRKLKEVLEFFIKKAEVKEDECERK